MFLDYLNIIFKAVGAIFVVWCLLVGFTVTTSIVRDSYKNWRDKEEGDR